MNAGTNLFLCDVHLQIYSFFHINLLWHSNWNYYISYMLVENHYEKNKELKCTQAYFMFGIKVI